MEVTLRTDGAFFSNVKLSQIKSFLYALIMHILWLTEQALAIGCRDFNLSYFFSHFTIIMYL